MSFHAFAIKQFQDQGENCLNIQPGELLRVVEIDENSEWWGGYKIGDSTEATGWFPGQTVRRLTDAEERRLNTTGSIRYSEVAPTTLQPAHNLNNSLNSSNFQIDMSTRSTRTAGGSTVKIVREGKTSKVLRHDPEADARAAREKKDRETRAQRECDERQRQIEEEEARRERQREREENRRLE